MRKRGRLLPVVLVALFAAGALFSRDPRTEPPPVEPGFLGAEPVLDEPAQITPAGPPPNIVFVMTDDLDWGLVEHMPVLQSLVRARGATFTNYFVTSALCCPSRSSFLRGQYPHNTKIQTNEDGFINFHRSGLESSTIATWLHAAGYRTALLGKYLNGYLEAPGVGLFDFVPPGWDDWVVAGDGFREIDYTLNRNGVLEPHGHERTDVLTDQLVAHATQFITASAAAQKPFFVELATFAPHEPYTPAPGTAALFEGAQAPRGAAFNAVGSGEPRWLAALPPLSNNDIASIDRIYRRRLQAVQGVDAAIGALIDVLTRTGALDNTYLVFTSDNGYHLGQHRLPPGKQTAFDSDIRVPLIVRGPGVTPRTIDAFAANIDLAATFVRWARASTPPFVDGRPLQPLLAGTVPADWRDRLLVEHVGPPTLPGDPDYQARDNPTSYLALRMARYVFVRYMTGEEELYDRAVDPDELVNRITSADPALVASLRASLAALSTCSADTCRRADRS